MLALTGCADDSSGNGGGSGQGVRPGATKEEYIEAFKDVDPIKLKVQTPSPKGAATGKPMEDYFAAVEEWSGGKITFDIAYSNAVAQPAEIDDALNDGRLDIASILPIYEPSEYPAHAQLIEGTIISHQSPVVGVLQSNAWPNEVAFANAEIMAEYERHNLVPLVPFFDSGPQALFCSEPRNSVGKIKGTSITASGTAQSSQIKAIGGTPVSVPYTEVFESLQRGVVDCANASFTVAVLGGFIPAAPHVAIDLQNGFALAPGGWAASKDTWDRLPLVARQLLWDRLDVYLESNIKSKIWPNFAEAVKQIRQNGGKVDLFAPDASEALKKQNETLVNQIRTKSGATDGNALVDAMQKAAQKWLTEAQNVGLPADVDYNNFDEWLSTANPDLSKYIEKLMNEIWLPRRPS